MISQKIKQTFFVLTLIIMFSISVYQPTAETSSPTEISKPADTQIDSINTIIEPIQTNAIVQDGVVNSGEYLHTQSYGKMGSSFVFSYTIDRAVVYMALKSPANGWISIGFGWDGKMKNSDTYTGYWTPSKSDVSDYWSTGDPGPSGIAVPDFDAQQDILSYGVGETGGYTTMEWSRYLETGDLTQDRVIAPGVSTDIMLAYRNSADSPDAINWIHTNDRTDTITFTGNPTTPRDLGLTFAESRVDLSWTGPLAMGGTFVNYKIYRSEAGGAFSLLNTITDVGTTTYADTTVTNGLEYKYVVTVSNTIGESGDSNEVSCIPMGPLNPPELLTGTYISSQVTLSWNPPTSNGGIPVHTYDVYRTTDLGSPFTLIGQNSSLTGYVDTTVINGYTYYYQVTGEHDFLVSDVSNTFQITPVGPSTPPLGLIAAYTDATVILNWSIPLSDGGFAISNYNVYRSQVQGGPYSLVGSSTTISYVDSTATNGETYYYVIKAENSAGESEQSNEQRITLLLVPDAPFSLQVTSGNHFVHITWSEPDGKGNPILNYTVYRAEPYKRYEVVGYTTNLFFNDTTVLNSVEYNYVITANNTIGESSYSAIAVGIPADKPSVPVNLAIELITTGMKLTWDDPVNNGGYFISYYSIYRSDGSSFTLLTTSQSKEYIDGAFTYGTEYSYKLTAHNNIGDSDFSEIVSMTPGVKPDIPLGFNVELVSGAVHMDWSAPYDGGSAINGYNIYRSEQSSKNYKYIGFANDLSYVDYANSSSKLYYVITAVNDYGESDYSNVESIVPATVPSEPINVIGIGSNSEAVLLWSVPLDDGGLTITSFMIYRSDNNETGFESISASESVLFSDKNVVNNQTYFYAITALNALGESNFSEVIEITPEKSEVDPSLLLNDSIGLNNNTFSELIDLEQVMSAALVMSSLFTVVVLVFVIRKFTK